MTGTTVIGYVLKEVIKHSWYDLSSWCRDYERVYTVRFTREVAAQETSLKSICLHSVNRNFCFQSGLCGRSVLILLDRSFDNRVGTLLNETLPILRRTVLTVVVIILSLVHFSINAACPEPIVESIETLSSSKVIQAVEEDTLRVLESGPTFKIYDAGVKQYGELTALVQSSNTPISLGEEMRPYMNTQRLWTFFRNNDISLQDDPPEELYVYNWIEKAQGKMIFDVGIPIREQEIGLRLRRMNRWSSPASCMLDLFHIKKEVGGRKSNGKLVLEKKGVYTTNACIGSYTTGMTSQIISTSPRFK